MNTRSPHHCPYCLQAVQVGDLIGHWQLRCAVLRRTRAFATTVTEPETPLLTRVWEQIEDILVETGFVS